MKNKKIFRTFAALCTTGHSVTNGDVSGFEVYVVDDQRTQLRRTQSSVQQQQNNCLATVGAGTAHHKLLSFFSLRFSRVNASLEKFFHILFCKCFNGMFLKLGGCDFFCRIGEFELHLQPSEKGTKRHPHIANGLGGQWLFTTIESHRLVLGAQPGHVTSKVGSLDFRNTPISNVFQPMVDHVFVGGTCALA